MLDQTAFRNSPTSYCRKSEIKILKRFLFTQTHNSTSNGPPARKKFSRRFYFSANIKATYYFQQHACLLPILPNILLF